MGRQWATGLVVLLLAAGCSSQRDDAAGEPSSPDPTTAAVTSAVTSSAVSASAAPGTSAPAAPRSYQVLVPDGYDAAVPLPLVVALHGYASSGAQIEAYLGLAPLAQQRGFLYVAPDGSADPRGNRFWDATDACCNFTGAPVDDAGYLAGLIDEVSAEYTVDPARVYVVGHSNGGFMAHRMACEHAATVAAVVSFAGATFADPADCDPAAQVNVLQVHGDADDTIGYAGGTFPGVYPGARQTVQTWRDLDGCGEGGTAPPIDLAADLPGPESLVSLSDCPDGSAVELWTVVGGGHTPALSPTFSAQVIDWLYAHPRR